VLTRNLARGDTGARQGLIYRDRRKDQTQLARFREATPESVPRCDRPGVILLDKSTLVCELAGDSVRQCRQAVFCAPPTCKQRSW
jgi:hypothetical protein